MTTSIVSNSNYSEIQVNGVPKLRIGADSSGNLAGFRNIIINGGFIINNGNAGTPYVSGAVLAAGQYGHEMWKAGASGGDYSFTQSPSNTQITIATGKSLIQVIEDKNVAGGNYILSWEGTAQARVGINSATPSSSYASSPILITGQSAGTTMSVEFGEGTLGKVQLEEGTIASKFETRPYQIEMELTNRYFCTIRASAGAAYPTASGATAWSPVTFPQPMRTVPSIGVVAEIGTNAVSAAKVNITKIGFDYVITQGGSVGNYNAYGTYIANARL